MVKQLKKAFRGNPDHPNHHRNNRTILVIGLIFTGLTFLTIIIGGFVSYGTWVNQTKTNSKDIESHNLRIQAAENNALGSYSIANKKADQKTIDSLIKAITTLTTTVNLMNELKKIKDIETDKKIEFLMENCRFKTRGEMLNNSNLSIK